MIQCIIAKQIGDNKYKFINCAGGGYLEHTGFNLIKYYKIDVKVDALLNLGNIASLEKNLSPNKNEPHDYHHRQKDVCLAYDRDCGYPSNGVHIGTITDIFQRQSPYVYLKDKNGKWLYSTSQFKKSNISKMTNKQLLATFDDLETKVILLEERYKELQEMKFSKDDTYTRVPLSVNNEGD